VSKWNGEWSIEPHTMYALYTPDGQWCGDFPTITRARARMTELQEESLKHTEPYTSEHTPG
jgi:hypothetical protein